MLLQDIKPAHIQQYSTSTRVPAHSEERLRKTKDQHKNFQLLKDSKSPKKQIKYLSMHRKAE